MLASWSHLVTATTWQRCAPRPELSVRRLMGRFERQASAASWAARLCPRVFTFRGLRETIPPPLAPRPWAFEPLEARFASMLFSLMMTDHHLRAQSRAEQQLESAPLLLHSCTGFGGAAAQATVSSCNLGLSSLVAR
mmetsp:Transcript_99400/g.207066  ORF Transcript_99400/g.207066 Transcript_99400/m.207066 type:complete len:137 (-) Transcript_99400:362-772(-)